MPLLLLAAIVKAPVWINDHRLARMVGRIQAYPLPSGTDFGYFDPQVEVSGDSGDCWYTIRFEPGVGSVGRHVITRAMKELKAESLIWRVANRGMIVQDPPSPSRSPWPSTVATNPPHGRPPADEPEALAT
ncbi:hypothetical protein [Nonomuraea sp. B1E8]|uniref:hypothetical protein n=1 Tax=unclassified Nonomuraea TaxID=2593643 RepID=UPI00325CD941